jgi:hypothetical protein
MQNDPADVLNRSLGKAAGHLTCLYVHNETTGQKLLCFLPCISARAIIYAYHAVDSFIAPSLFELSKYFQTYYAVFLFNSQPLQIKQKTRQACQHEACWLKQLTVQVQGKERNTP